MSTLRAIDLFSLMEKPDISQNRLRVVSKLGRVVCCRVRVRSRSLENRLILYELGPNSCLGYQG